MLYRSSLLSIAALLMISFGCGSGRSSTAAFHMPKDGDAERGKIAFVKHGCHTCHEVAGAGLERPSVEPPVPVVLGGLVDDRLSDAYLVTSIIDPSWRLAPHPDPQQIASGSVSRMPSYADRMTVREVIDTVTFLQSRYMLRPVPPAYNYR